MTFSFRGQKYQSILSQAHFDYSVFYNRDWIAFDWTVCARKRESFYQLRGFGSTENKQLLSVNWRKSISESIKRLEQLVRQTDDSIDFRQQYCSCARHRLTHFSCIKMLTSVCLSVCLSLTVSCRLKKVVVSCVLPTQALVSSGGPTATLGTNVSRLPAKGCALWNSLPAGVR